MGIACYSAEGLGTHSWAGTAEEQWPAPHHPWKCSKLMGMWHLMWFGGEYGNGAGLMVGPDDV